MAKKSNTVPTVDNAGYVFQEGLQVLEAFARALRRESHGLIHRPDLLWQQLFNRLQWEEKEIGRLLTTDLDVRQLPDASPWLRSRTPPQESDALVATYAEHSGQVCCCAISPDGTFVASGGQDGVRVWDLASAQHRVAMEGFGSGGPFHFCCAISPDQSLVASGNGEGMLTLWEWSQGGRYGRSKPMMIG